MAQVKEAETLVAREAEDELFLIDGSGFIFRAYYALAYSGAREMTDPEGTPVGAVFGFTNMLLKMLSDYHAPYIAVIFDAARANFRNDIYADYKANRDETPEDLIPQFPLIRQAVEAFDMPALEMEGYEADDLIAAYTKMALARGKDVVIVSSDKDLMQLVRPGVRMLDPMKGIWIGEAEVREKFGVGPERVVDVQALAGDAVDNVPGVPGIGIKTAAELINEYGSLEALLERAGEIKQPKRREKLIENAENARISKQLVRLDENAPVPVPLDELKTHNPDKPALMAFLQKHGFNSIIKRLGGAVVAKSHAEASVPSKGNADPQDHFVPETLPSPLENQYTLINDAKTLQAWLDEAQEAGVLAVDTETTDLTPAKAKLVGVSLSSKVGKAAYLPLGHVQGGDLFGGPVDGQVRQMDMAEALAILKPALEDESLLKVGHNIKYDWQIFAKHGIRVSPCDDTMLLSFILDGAQHGHGMDYLAELHCGHQTIKYEDVAGKGKNQVTFEKVAIDKALDYAAEDAEITLRLHKILKPRLAREKMAGVYEDIERPLIPVIAQMELDGVKVDPAVLHAMSTDFGKKLVELETEIHALAGHKFNVSSPKQVGEVLFDEMGLQGGKKTKTGVASTSVDILEKLALEGHEIVIKILEYRQLSKLKSTYTDALPGQINPATGRVHTSYNMAGASTGRLASTDPNLQNIPIRTEEGRKIREAFVAKEGCVLLSVDYSQVELRLVAEMAGVAALQKAFRDGDDIHALTASQVFDVPLAEVTPDIRRQAKAVNFGIIYGISGFGLARQLGCSAGEASAFIKRYLSRFHEIETYMQETKDAAKRDGYVKTLYGRKCYIPGIKDKNQMRVRGAERQAINAPLQGTAADIMKIAMIRIPGALEKAGLKARMLLQVHDELIFEVPEGELEQTSILVRDIMQRAAFSGGVNITVPLLAEAGSGQSWAEAH
ncbi:MAG: DNA polymerase I [Alphaproteobacteria bacterium]|nr:DNA polymerase I [Alphaproteobacteria bacterium]